MPKIKLDALHEGMVVTADVKNLDDMLLIPAGCELTARHIRILQTWGVSEVTVESAGEDEDHTDPLSRLSPEVAARLTSETKATFWNFDESNAIQKELLRLSILRKARQLVDKS